MSANAGPEFWTNLSAVNPWDPDKVAARAVVLEADGWDGATQVDTQNIAADPYVCLAMASKVTTRLQLATGVSNTVTRHPAVTAGAMASLQVASGGRAVLGIGRGDSALAYLGASPMPLKPFEQYLGLIQRYLRGETIPLEDVMPTVHGTRTGYDNLALGHAPEGSALTWLPDDLPKVPMDVAATGPKAIGVAARVAERLTFAVGADLERLGWAINTAREAAQAAGRDPAEISFGAYVSAMPHNDLSIARQLVSGAVAGIARFSIMNKKVMGPTSDHQRDTFEKGIVAI